MMSYSVQGDRRQKWSQNQNAYYFNFSYPDWNACNTLWSPLDCLRGVVPHCHISERCNRHFGRLDYSWQQSTHHAACIVFDTLGGLCDFLFLYSHIASQSKCCHFQSKALQIKDKYNILHVSAKWNKVQLQSLINNLTIFFGQNITILSCVPNFRL